MIALQATNAAPPTSALPSSSDVGQAFTVVQWIEAHPWGLFVVFVLAALVYFGFWVPKLIRGWGKRYDATLAQFAAAREQARELHEDTLREFREQHANLLAAGNERTQCTVNAFQEESREDRRSCDERTTRSVAEIVREIRDTQRGPR